jgi:hypothetical protein
MILGAACYFTDKLNKLRKLDHIIGCCVKMTVSVA